MWTDDRRFHVRALQKMQSDTEVTIEVVGERYRELAEDDYNGTEDTRARLVEAKQALESAAGALERACEQLPEGKVRPPLYPLARRKPDA